MTTAIKCGICLSNIDSSKDLYFKGETSSIHSKCYEVWLREIQKQAQAKQMPQPKSPRAVLPKLNSPEAPIVRTLEDRLYSLNNSKAYSHLNQDRYSLDVFQLWMRKIQRSTEMGKSIQVFFYLNRYKGVFVCMDRVGHLEKCQSIAQKRGYPNIAELFEQELLEEEHLLYNS